MTVFLYFSLNKYSLGEHQETSICSNIYQTNHTDSELLKVKVIYKLYKVRVVIYTPSVRLLQMNALIISPLVDKLLLAKEND